MTGKHFMYAIAMLLLPFISKADGGMPKLQLGIKAGVNVSSLNGDNWDNGYKTNLLGGLEAGLYGNRVGISLEAFFSQSSYVTGDNFHNIYEQYYNNVSDSAKQGTFRVSYLNIPILFNLKLVKGLWLQLGPQYSGVVSVKDVDALVHDAKGLFKSGDVSGVAGLRLNLPFHLSVGARYVFGFTDLNNMSIGDTWQQRTVQVHVVYNLL
ncbi:porin family protein [Chitinophagaceae bacterium MMS25-I14]